MQRIVSACLQQTNKFECMADYNSYLAALDQKKCKYVIVSVKENSDGTVICMINRQYNNYSVGNYLD